MTEIKIGKIIYRQGIDPKGNISLDFYLEDFRLSQNQSEIIIKCQSIENLDDNILHVKRGDHNCTEISIT